SHAFVSNYCLPFYEVVARDCGVPTVCRPRFITALSLAVNVSSRESWHIMKRLLEGSVPPNMDSSAVALASTPVTPATPTPTSTSASASALAMAASNDSAEETMRDLLELSD